MNNAGTLFLILLGIVGIILLCVAMPLLQMGKRRKQKKVDRFLLQVLAAQSDGYKDVLTAAFGKIRKLSHALPGDGKELMISYAKDVPLLDCPNDDCPFCSFKTNYGWIDFHVLNGKISFVNFETAPHLMDISRCVIEKVTFYPELFSTPGKQMLETQTKEFPADWGNAVADLPPFQERFISAYLNAYRMTLPATLQELFRCCNGASSGKWCIYGMHEWSRCAFGAKNLWSIGCLEETIYLLLDDSGKFYTCDDDMPPEEIAKPLTEFLKGL